MKNILIAGGTGFIGNILSKKLYNKGYNIKHLSTKKYILNKYPTYYWNIYNNIIDLKAFYDIDIIINLAGNSIFAKRWNFKQKKNILYSRINTTNLILENIKKFKIPINTFIGTGGISFYSHKNLNVINHKYPIGNNFLYYVTKLLEFKVLEFASLGIRSIYIRSAIVLSKYSKILKLLYYMIKYYVGSTLGSGNQYFPWIHIYDLCNIYISAIENITWNGVYNAIAPEQIRNKDFIKKLSIYFQKPLWLPNIPSFIIKLIYGEISDIILNGKMIDNKKLLQDGFIFKYPTLESSLNEIYS